VLGRRSGGTLSVDVSRLGIRVGADDGVLPDTATVLCSLESRLGSNPSMVRSDVQPPEFRSSADLGAEDPDEADHLAWVATQVVGQPELPAVRDTPVGRRLTSQLQPHLEEHA
jgi:hypothetical protein